MNYILNESSVLYLFHYYPDFVKRNLVKKYINWKKLSQCKLSPEFIQEYIKELDLFTLLKYNNENITDSCLLTNFNDPCLLNSTLFLRQYNESTFEEYPDSFNWDIVSCTQRLSPEFIAKNYNFLNIKMLLKFNTKISLKTKSRFRP